MRREGMEGRVGVGGGGKGKGWDVGEGMEKKGEDM